MSNKESSGRSPTLSVVWSARDAHEVFQRAATVQAVRAVAAEFPQTVAESPVLADIFDAEGLS